MKRVAIFVILLSMTIGAMAQEIRYVDATTLNICGHAMRTEKSPYYRFDCEPYNFSDKVLRSYSRIPAGLYVMFKTDSREIRARWENLPRRMGDNTTGLSQHGLDLYIEENGVWKFCAVGRVSTLPEKSKRARTIVKNMSEGEKLCMLYLPLWCELTSLEIGVEKGAYIEAIPSPYKHKVITFGSSITHGASASRPGMTYTARMSRALGIDFINFGFSGRSKLQPEFLEFLKRCEADAFLFDAFSNPSEAQIVERLEGFVKGMVEAHPGKPLIFLQSPIDQDSKFNAKKYAARMSLTATAAKMMKRLQKQYKDVYFLAVPDVLGTDGTIDNSHPTDLGFDRFLKAYQPKIKGILQKYGIR